MPEFTRKTVGGLTFVNIKAFGSEWSLSYCRKSSPTAPKAKPAKEVKAPTEFQLGLFQ